MKRIYVPAAIATALGVAVASPIGARTNRVGHSLHVEMCWLSWK
jgi:uncharacterized membrane protein YfcA